MALDAHTTVMPSIRNADWCSSGLCSAAFLVAVCMVVRSNAARSMSRVIIGRFGGAIVLKYSKRIKWGQTTFSFDFGRSPGFSLGDTSFYHLLDF